MKEHLIEIDTNTFILSGTVIQFLENNSSGEVYKAFDEVLKMGDNHTIQLLTVPAVLNYLIKFHKIEFSAEFLGGVKAHRLDYSAHKQIDLYL